MRKYLLITLIVMSQPLVAQKILYYADWSIGDSYDFKITKIKQSWKNSVLSSSDSIQFLSNFTVIDSSDSTYTIRWSLKKNIIDTYEIPEEIVNKYSQFRIPDVIYKTNHLGQFIGIDNIDSLSFVMDLFLKESVNIIAAKANIEIEELSDKIKPILSVIESKESFNQLLFNEIILIHFPFGALLSPKKPVRYKDSYPNSLGGKPIPCNVKIEIKRVNYDSARCVFVNDVYIDQKSSKDFLTDILTTLRKNSREIKLGLKSLNFDMTDHNIFDYYYYPGIPINIDTKRTRILDLPNSSVTTIDRIKIELINKQNVL
jgi:hypothetical protein